MTFTYEGYGRLAPEGDQEDWRIPPDEEIGSPPPPRPRPLPAVVHGATVTIHAAQLHHHRWLRFGERTVQALRVWEEGQMIHAALEDGRSVHFPLAQLLSAAYPSAVRAGDLVPGLLICGLHGEVREVWGVQVTPQEVRFTLLGDPPQDVRCAPDELLELPGETPQVVA